MLLSSLAWMVSNDMHAAGTHKYICTFCCDCHVSCLFHAGYHYTRQQLDQFPDPDEAHARRGAYWTFDGAAFVEKMHELRVKGSPC